MGKTAFTLEQALNIQADNLKNWKLKLNIECFESLESWVKTSNNNVTDPYKIIRGEDLNFFIDNWKPISIKFEDLMSHPFLILVRTSTHFIVINHLNKKLIFGYIDNYGWHIENKLNSIKNLVNKQWFIDYLENNHFKISEHDNGQEIYNYLVI